MSTVADLRSGKDHRDENFPVASILIRAEHRPVILAFYRFARAADDVADDVRAPEAEKLRLLDAFGATLAGDSDEIPEAATLRDILKARNLTAQHGLDLLEAFRRDVTVHRYAGWNALMEYCCYSAMPVGRFVLDVHGESRQTWPANDALCAALQIINHLQDCGKDYRNLDRVYIPLDALAEQGTDVSALGERSASPGLRRTICGLARRTDALLDDARPFASQIQDARLALEVTVIQRLAEDLTQKITNRDPLCECVHHSKLNLIPLLLRAGLRFVAARPSRFRLAGHSP